MDVYSLYQEEFLSPATVAIGYVLAILRKGRTLRLFKPRF